MKTHPQIGADIIQPHQQGILAVAYNVSLTHHEKWDGSGYPQGLTEEEIPLEGRIVAIADVFDALTSARPYKKAWSVEQSIQLLKDERDKQFERNLVEKFIKILPEVLKIKDQYTET